MPAWRVPGTIILHPTVKLSQIVPRRVVCQKIALGLVRGALADIAIGFAPRKPHRALMRDSSLGRRHIDADDLVAWSIDRRNFRIMPFTGNGGALPSLKPFWRS
jgi:hypothetical protein